MVLGSNEISHCVQFEALKCSLFTKNLEIYHRKPVMLTAQKLKFSWSCFVLCAILLWGHLLFIQMNSQTGHKVSGINWKTMLIP